MLLTARAEEHREVTEEWLARHGFKWHSAYLVSQGEEIIIG